MILAYLYHCDALVAYDEHFADTSHLVPYLHPGEAVARLSAANQRTSP